MQILPYENFHAENHSCCQEIVGCASGDARRGLDGAPYALAWGYAFVMLIRVVFRTRRPTTGRAQWAP